MYYIYHIPDFIHKDGSIGKIGCSTEPDRRVKRQGYTNYEILETHIDIDIADIREKELQKQYGYKVDTAKYKQSRNWAKSGSVNGGKATGKLVKETDMWKKWQSAGIIAAKQKRIKAVDCYDFKTGDFISTYESAAEAARQLKIARGCIVGCLSKRRGTKQTHGYSFKYNLNQT